MHQIQLCWNNISDKTKHICYKTYADNLAFNIADTINPLWDIMHIMGHFFYLKTYKKANDFIGVATIMDLVGKCDILKYFLVFFLFYKDGEYWMKHLQVYLANKCVVFNNKVYDPNMRLTLSEARKIHKYFQITLNPAICKEKKANSK